MFQGEVVLALPSVEVLAEVAANKGRKVAVLHVLETTVVGWSKQIEVLLFCCFALCFTSTFSLRCYLSLDVVGYVMPVVPKLFQGKAAFLKVIQLTAPGFNIFSSS